MQKNWFVRWGWFHRPVSWQAWLVTLLALAFCVQVFIAVDSRSHSVSDTLYGVFPFIVPTLLLLDLIASRTDGSA